MLANPEFVKNYRLEVSKMIRDLTIAYYDNGMYNPPRTKKSLAAELGISAVALSRASTGVTSLSALPYRKLCAIHEEFERNRKSI